MEAQLLLDKGVQALQELRVGENTGSPEIGSLLSTGMVLARELYGEECRRQVKDVARRMSR
jgi:hypothetical protein